MMPPSVSCGAIFSSLIDPTQGASIGIFAPGPACLYAILGICQNTSSGIATQCHRLQAENSYDASGLISEAVAVNQAA